MIDLTNPAALKWKEQNLEKVQGSGFLKEAHQTRHVSYRLRTVLFNGESGWVMRNFISSSLCQRIKKKILGDDAMVISQTGYAGMEKTLIRFCGGNKL